MSLLLMMELTSLLEKMIKSLPVMELKAETQELDGAILKIK